MVDNWAPAYFWHRVRLRMQDDSARDGAITYRGLAMPDGQTLLGPGLNQFKVLSTRGGRSNQKSPNTVAAASMLIFLIIESSA